MKFNLFLYYFMLVIMCIEMEIANNDWINQKVNSSSCTFPDCKNGSSCQCSKCFNLYCYAHLQIHFGFCNDLNDVVKVKEEMSNFEIIDQTYSIRNVCLS